MPEAEVNNPIRLDELTKELTKLDAIRQNIEKIDSLQFFDEMQPRLSGLRTATTRPEDWTPSGT